MARPESAPAGTLIVLDRDGVLNRLLDNPAEPRPDSPMRPSEVEVFPWVPAVLRDLTAAGFGLVIASNQPAAAKGKTTRAELEAAHAEVLRAATASGGVILSSHVCFHRAEDGCACRKPATGLLEEAFARHVTFAPARSWMVGDRAPGYPGRKRVRPPDRVPRGRRLRGIRDPGGPRPSTFLSRT